MRCRPEHLHSTRRQVDDEDGVIPHQAAARPDFRGEEIGSGDRAPMRAQERLPRRGPVRHGRKAVRFQDPGNRRSADAVPEVCQRALNPRIAPRRVLRHHAHDQPADLPEHASTARRRLRVCPLPRDQVPVPTQQRIGGDDRGDLAQPPTPQPVRPNGEPPPVVIGQVQAPSDYPRSAMSRSAACD
jgi:hypothetical protein